MCVRVCHEVFHLVVVSNGAYVSQFMFVCVYEREREREREREKWGGGEKIAHQCKVHCTFLS